MRKYYSSQSGFRKETKPSKAYWIDVTVPDDSDMEFLTLEEGVPQMFLEYLSDNEERPRVERDGEWTMTILRIPVESHDLTMPYKTVPLGVISRDAGRVITVCWHDVRITDEFVDHTVRKSITISCISEFILRVFYAASFWYLSYLKTFTGDVVGTERAMQSSIENSDLLRLMRMQKSLVFFNTSIKGNLMVLERIQKIYGDEIDHDLAEDVEIELRQADSTVDIYTNILESTLDAYASIISNNVNNVMKRMTGLSIVLILPTFVASLYGMNVNLFISDYQYAFWFVISVAAFLTIVAFLCLRKIKWL